MAELEADRSAVRSVKGKKRKVGEPVKGEDVRQKSVKTLNSSQKKPKQSFLNGQFGGESPVIDGQIQKNKKVSDSVIRSLPLSNETSQRNSSRNLGSMTFVENNGNSTEEYKNNFSPSGASRLSTKSLRKLTKKRKSVSDLEVVKPLAGESPKIPSKRKKNSKPPAGDSAEIPVKTKTNSKLPLDVSPRMAAKTKISKTKKKSTSSMESLKERITDRSLDKREVRKTGGGAKINRMQRVEKPPLDGTAAQQAEWLWQACVSHFNDKLSALERDPLTERNILVLTPSKLASSNKLSSLASNVISNFKEELDVHSQGGAEAGSPLLLTLCPAALRCTEILRALRPVSKGNLPAKLFSKHMKVEEQVETLKNPVLLAAGTPARVERLTSLGALGLSELRLLLLDVSCNAKGFTLLDIPETRVDFWNFYWTHLHKRVLEGQLRICLLA